MLASLKKTLQLFFAGKHKIKARQLEMPKDLSGASSTVLFFCIGSKEELTNIRVLLKKVHASGKQLTAYVFFQGYQSLDVVTDKSLFFFNLNDFTLFARMKDSLKQQIQESSFDLLISFNPSDNPFCIYLIAIIKADFKVGPHRDQMNNLFDITLNADVQKMGIADFYQQVLTYLQALNISRK